MSARTGVGRVVRNRNAGPYLGGVLVSAFGTSAMALAAGIWAKSLTGSSSLAALTTFCVWAPTVAGPVIGLLADRVRRRPLLIWVNVGMAGLLPVLVVVRSASAVWILFAVLVAYGISIVVVDAAEAALVPPSYPASSWATSTGCA